MSVYLPLLHGCCCPRQRLRIPHQIRWDVPRDVPSAACVAFFSREGYPIQFYPWDVTKDIPSDVPGARLLHRLQSLAFPAHGGLNEGWTMGRRGKDGSKDWVSILAEYSPLC